MYILYLIPKNWLSRIVGWCVARRWPLGMHRMIRDRFISHFRVETSEAEFPLERYATLGEFFTRRLRGGARPLAASAFVSPVDGMLTQRGVLASPELQLTQIKGISYTLQNLFGENWDVRPYAGGAFLTLYLAPWNYHRIHAPASGKVLRARHIAGALWPVNRWSVERIPDLFVRNDRMVVEMECDGVRLSVVLVGATNVGKITLAFHPEFVGNSGPTGLRDWRPTETLHLDKGGELGCFGMGSTVVLIVDAPGAKKLNRLLTSVEPIPIRMGEDLTA